MQETEPAKTEEWEGEQDLSQKLTKHLKAVRAAYEEAILPAEKINVGLYVFPKLMETVKEVEMDNIRRREQGEAEIHVEEFPDFKKLIEYGLITEDNDTKHVIHTADGKKEQMVHSTGHLTGIKERAQRDWQEEHPKE